MPCVLRFCIFEKRQHGLPRPLHAYRASLLSGLTVCCREGRARHPLKASLRSRQNSGPGHPTSCFVEHVAPRPLDLSRGGFSSRIVLLAVPGLGIGSRSVSKPSIRKDAWAEECTIGNSSVHKRDQEAACAQIQTAKREAGRSTTGIGSQGPEIAKTLGGAFCFPDGRLRAGVKHHQTSTPD